MTRYAISVKSGVDQATLSKFMKGQRGFSMESLDKLVEVLGLTVTVNPKRKEVR